MLFPVSLDGAISQSQWRRPFSFPAALHLAAPSAAADGRETPGPRRFVRDDVIIQGDDGCCCDDSIASSTKRDASFNSPFVFVRTNSALGLRRRLFPHLVLAQTD